MAGDNAEPSAAARSNAARNTNGLKIDPGCRLALTARLNCDWLYERPPTMARMSSGIFILYSFSILLDILAMVGGRSYNQSQFNRAVSANRQPGSIFKPFVFLAAFERAAEDGTEFSPATLVNDEPTTFDANGTPWTPANYENEYDGEITLRRALAMSRNAAAVKVAEAAGFDRVADLWRRIGAGTAPRAFPSIALGVFEATPHDIASAYTIFPMPERSGRSVRCCASSAATRKSWRRSRR